jgi:hypothetical protein
MATYVICKNRQDRKVELAVCLTNCKAQFECDNFNEVPREITLAAAEKLGLVPEGFVAPYQLKSETVINVDEQTEEPAEKEEVESNTPQVQESDDTDVRREIIERPPAVPSVSKAQQLYEQVLSLKAEIEVRWFDLGKILEEIFEGRHYIDLGYTNWKDFCEVALGPLELKWRAIDYLRMTRKKCDEVGIGREIAGEIGWSRLKEIGPVVTKKNRDHWIDVARNKKTTVHMLWGKVQVALGRKTEKEVEILPEKISFPLFKEQKENVERALELAGRMTNSDKRGNQLEMVCAEFRGTYESEDAEFSKARIITGLLGRIQAVMKVKFIGDVVDETGEILVEGEG